MPPRELVCLAPELRQLSKATLDANRRANWISRDPDVLYASLRNRGKGFLTCVSGAPRPRVESVNQPDNPLF